MTNKEHREIPLEWLVCPFTKEKLRERDGILEAARGARYSKDAKFGFWDFIPSEYDQSAKAAWKAWETLQENGLSSYEEDPIANVAVGPIPEYVAFGEFCDFRGNVLDVGVGPQAAPTHLDQCVKK